MALFFLHGVVDEWSAGAATHRNYVAREWFERHLRGRIAPYGEWKGKTAEGDFLSVDDATRAGAAACRVARELGHEVIFFVNPLQVATGTPYFFSVLDAALDTRTVSSVVEGEEIFDLVTPARVRRFRRAAKARLMTLPAEEALAAAHEIARRLGTEVAAVPPHCEPVTLDDLRQLRDCGVRVENHGWSHVEISALTDDEFARHVRSAQSWLCTELGVAATLYAVPFGLSDVTPERQRHVPDGYFLADGDRPPERLGPLCWNRHDLTDLFQH